MKFSINISRTLFLGICPNYLRRQLWTWPRFNVTAVYISIHSTAPELCSVRNYWILSILRNRLTSDVEVDVLFPWWFPGKRNFPPNLNISTETLSVNIPVDIPTNNSIVRHKSEVVNRRSKKIIVLPRTMI